jgi:hypothetical protein
MFFSLRTADTRRTRKDCIRKMLQMAQSMRLQDL